MPLPRGIYFTRPAATEYIRGAGCLDTYIVLAYVVEKKRGNKWYFPLFDLQMRLRSQGFYDLPDFRLYLNKYQRYRRRKRH